MPVRDISPHCLAPYECDFKAHCWAQVPEPSVLSLARMPADGKFDLYHRGIRTFAQITPDLELTGAQGMQVEAELHDRQFIDRLVELMAVFQGRSYYVSEMNGSYSIKKVLPAVCPEMSYHGLEIGDGQMAILAFTALQNLTGPGEIQQIRQLARILQAGYACHGRDCQAAGPTGRGAQ